MLRVAIGLAFRSFSTCSRHSTKVSVLGAGGGIGQPLSLLICSNPLLSNLALYDVKDTRGIACDLSHINTNSRIVGYSGSEELEECLKDSEIVVIPAGLPRKPGMTRDDLFNTNAEIVQSLAKACAKYCPTAKVAVITNPVNSTVPIVAEVFESAGVYDPRKIFGVCTLDTVRAKKFVADLKGVNATTLHVPVIGGHSGITILPLLSQITPKLSLSSEEICSLTERIQNAGTEVVNAKAGGGSATLSMAYAGALFTDALLRAGKGDPVVECAYVESNITEVKFFSSSLLLGPEGVTEHLGFGTLSAYEEDKLRALLPELDRNITKGLQFGKQ
ncbi:malate dehydrogenase, mitochondrial-like isoform X1 [Zophobas morio]|uniref:malate dehydrogenase, mitochondrial-like isoform X1 n=1 Tax=Zophobas morio TaxID=2755281 RepID=UPI0030828C52